MMSITEITEQFHKILQVASNWDAGYGNGQYWNGNSGYHINGNGRVNGGYAVNGQAAVASDAKIQNGQPGAGAGKKARKDKRRSANALLQHPFLSQDPLYLAEERQDT